MVSLIANVFLVSSITIFIVTYFIRNGNSSIEGKSKLLLRIGFILLLIGIIASIPDLKSGAIEGWNAGSHQSEK